MPLIALAELTSAGHRKINWSYRFEAGRTHGNAEDRVLSGEFARDLFDLSCTVDKLGVDFARALDTAGGSRTRMVSVAVCSVADVA
ncbi:hypothetical protein [Nocardia sp. NPDC004860]|uniref:hypothetical protein n=1 Tax=Nocardia sp. NPDC004860 TaxID=3154557 RepID=UPI0033ADF346